MQTAENSRIFLSLCVVLFTLSGVSSTGPATGQGRQSINLELALLVDVSASVNDEEFRLQSKGLAAAFRSPRVLTALGAMARGGMAVCVVQWADHEHQHLSVEWTVLERDTDVLHFAERIESMPRDIDGGHTAIGDALAFGLNEIRSNRYAGARRVIDLSGDGRYNDGRSLRSAREDVLKHGITINGLAILNELPLLASYFRDQLIGGPGAFVITAQDYSDFAHAMSLKLDREIRSAPVANNSLPDATTNAPTDLAVRSR